MDKLNLLCLPYAGSSSMCFLSWRRDFITHNIQVVPIELPGRGKRIKETLIQSFPKMMEDVWLQVQPYIEQGNYGIFGHSMGATLGFELARKIQYEGKELPKYLFLSGMRAPTVEKDMSCYGDLDDEAFIRKIISFGGMSEEVLENDELMTLFLPIMRADFKVLESYQYQQLETALSCKAAVLFGSEDEETTEQNILPWQDCFREMTIFQRFKGNHFFINSNQQEVTTIIKQLLT